MPPVSLQLNMPIQSARLVNEQTDAPADPEPANPEFLSQQRQQVDSLCNALQQAAEKLHRNTEALFFNHKEQIVRLSVEIASRILAKDIHQQNYEIQEIILQALQTIPASKQITIRLNPNDFKTMQEMTGTEPFSAPENVQLTPDRSVKPAECIIETDHGIIEYLIEEHLKQIETALLKTTDKT